MVHLQKKVGTDLASEVSTPRYPAHGVVLPEVGRSRPPQAAPKRWPMLEVRELTKRYHGIPAVDGVSFTIKPGEVSGYLGPNGSGKTTTVKILTGLAEPSRGHVFFDGQDIQRNLIEFRKRLGYVPEEPHLYPYMSGREYLQLVGRLRSIPQGVLDRKTDGLLELFGLHGHRHSAISTYSKGMKQKVLIAAALLHNPDLLIFDEPLSGLDVTSMLVFRNVVN